MKGNMKLAWAFPKWLLWLTILIVVLFPLCGLFWFLFRFNIPFFNAGDRWVFILFIIVWWMSCSLTIFGWRLKTGDKVHKSRFQSQLSK